jgi:hypothetical protein
VKSTDILLVILIMLVWFFGTKITERLGKLIRMKGGVPPGDE